MKLEKIGEEIFEWAFLAAAILGLSAYVWAFPEMLLQTNDTAHYLAASSGFVKEIILLDANGDPFHFWPPLFPVFVSLFRDAQESLWIVHLFLFIANLLALRILAVVFLSNAFFRTIFFLMSALGVHHFLMAGLLLSEMLFASVLIWSMIMYFDYLRSKNDVYLLWYLISAFVFCLIRNAGVFIALGVALHVLYDWETKSWQLKKALVFSFPLMGNLIWNLYALFIQNPARAWTSFDVDYLANVTTLLEKTLVSFLPTQGFAPVIPIIISSILLVLLLTLFVKSKAGIKPNTSALLYLFLAYAAGHVVLVNVEPTEVDRFFAPITWFVLLFVFFVMETYYQQSKQYLVKYSIALLILCFSLYPLYRSYHNLTQWNEHHEIAKRHLKP